MTFIEEIASAELIGKQESEFLSSWITYTNEAHWGWSLIESDVRKLAKESKILELGSGPNILAAQVTSTGMQVTAVEPSGQGFSVMSLLGKRVHEYATKREVVFETQNLTGEKLSEIEKYDYIYSVNVMEHVSDVYKVLDNAVTALKPNATYRFVCPNYGFPFEPHFNVPTFLNKRLTNALMRRYALNRSTLPDAIELWNSLNWITVSKLRRWAKANPGVAVAFSNYALNSYILRGASDEVFQKRHPRLTKLSVAAEPILLGAAKLLPKRISPFIDIRITKITSD